MEGDSTVALTHVMLAVFGQVFLTGYVINQIWCLTLELHSCVLFANLAGQKFELPKRD